MPARPRFGWIRWIVLAGSVLAAARALAQPKHGVALNWVRLHGAESCVAAAQLAERVEGRLERKVFVLDARAAISIDGHVSPRAEGGFEAQVAVLDAEQRVLGQRALESRSADCRELDEALALVIAITLMPQSASQPGVSIDLAPGTDQLLSELFESEPTTLDPGDVVQTGKSEADRPDDVGRPREAGGGDLPPLAAGPDGASPHVSSGAGSPDPRPRATVESERRTFAFGAGPLLSAGYLPGLTVGVEVNALVSLPVLWPLRLAAVLLAPHERVSGAARTRFSLRQLALALCPWQTGDALRLQVCAGLSLAQLLADSDGYAVGGGERSDLMLDANALLELRWRVWSHAILQLGLAASLPFIQRTYVDQALDGQPETLFRTAQVCAQARFGVGVTF
jgi:hypothetical protein